MAILQLALAFSLALLLPSPTAAKTYDLQVDGGAIPDNTTLAAAWINGGAFNATLAKLQPGDTLLVPNRSFYLMGGIQTRDKVNVTIRIDGTLSFSNDIKAWPRKGNGQKAVSVVGVMPMWPHIVSASMSCATPLYTLQKASTS